MNKVIKSTSSLYRYKSIDNNSIICDDKNIKLINSQIIINGENNIIFLGKSIIIENSTINIDGDNNIIYLSESKECYRLKLNIYNNSTFYCGKNNYFNGLLNVIISECTSVIIGDHCLFSFEIWLRTADPHLIYDQKTKKRINMSKNIYIGDHVWVGQRAFLLKGSRIGSGSIVGAGSIKAGKVYSNTICAGNPAKEVKEKIFWKNRCVHRWTKEDTMESMYTKLESVYTTTKKNNFFNNLDKALNIIDVNERYDFIITNLVKKKNKYRFSISKDTFIIKCKRIIKRFLDLFSD